MRRGLILWDENELPLNVLRQRTNRLRQKMKSADCDAIILYTNFIRCAAVAWLTGFSPYWADGILVVTREGDPLFATTLSKRMASWIQGVMPNGTVVTNPNPGQLAGKRLAETGARRIGILELPYFPAGLYADLAANLRAEFFDAPGLFARARWPADETERNLLRRADEIAQKAVWQAELDTPGTVGELVAAVEKSARLDGAEEVYVAVAPDLDRSRNFLRLSGGAPLGRRFAVRATVAWKGSWARRIRTMSRDPQDAGAIGAQTGPLRNCPKSHRPVYRRAALRSKSHISPVRHWMTGPQRRRLERGHWRFSNSPPAAGQPFVLTLKLLAGDFPWIGAGLIAAA